MSARLTAVTATLILSCGKPPAESPVPDLKLPLLVEERLGQYIDATRLKAVSPMRQIQDCRIWRMADLATGAFAARHWTLEAFAGRERVARFPQPATSEAGTGVLVIDGAGAPPGA